jgi:hypothetical protein
MLAPPSPFVDQQQSVVHETRVIFRSEQEKVTI